MKVGLRKPSLTKSFKARTTGRLKRSVKRAANPFYGKKGTGYIHNPKKAVYNKIYNKTSFSLRDAGEKPWLIILFIFAWPCVLVFLLFKKILSNRAQTGGEDMSLNCEAAPLQTNFAVYDAPEPGNDSLPENYINSGEKQMKVCVYCGSDNKDDAERCVNCNASEFKNKCLSCGALYTGNFCDKCGTKRGLTRNPVRSVETPMYVNVNNNSSGPNTLKKKTTFGRVLLWIFFLPVMATIAVWRKDWDKKRKIIATAVIWILYFFFYGIGNAQEAEDANTDTRTAVTVSEPESPLPEAANYAIEEDAVSIELSTDSIAVKEGEEFTVLYTVIGGNSEDKVSLVSENTNIVQQLSGDTFVAGISGQTKIVLTCGAAEAECTVTVEKLITNIVELIPEQTVYDVPVGSETEIKFTYTPEDAEYTELEFSASNELIRIEDGIIFSLEPGDSEVTISQSGRELAVITVHSQIVEADAVSFSPLEEVAIGSCETITVVVSPDGGYWDHISFNSSNPDILEIADTSVPGQISVLGKKKGTATVKANFANSVSSVISGEISVYEILPSELQIVPDNQTPRVGDTGTLELKFSPEDTSNRNVTWKSSNTKVIKVASDGTYEAVSVGTAVISGTHKNGVSASVAIEVLPVEVEKIALSSSFNPEDSFHKGIKQTLSATIEPENATSKVLSWTSSNETIATVNSKGVVTAVAAGDVVITATAENGVSGSIPITVDISPQKFKVTIAYRLLENNHLGNNWTNEFYLDDTLIRSGSVVVLMPYEDFTVSAYFSENDSNPDVGDGYETFTLSDEMCSKGFTYEDEIGVRENGGRYSGNYAYWYVKITFKPIN